MMHNFQIFRNQTCQFDKIRPLKNGTLVTFVNNCLYAMIEQLNNFACYVESRMITLDRQIDTCFSNLVILEMKLNSINVPEQIAENAAESSAVADTNIAAKNITENEKNKSVSSNRSDTLLRDATDLHEAKESPESGEPGANRLSDSERQEEEEELPEELQRYQKMIKFGVHPNAVRQKMILEGIDPARLNL